MAFPKVKDVLWVGLRGYSSILGAKMQMYSTGFCTLENASIQGLSI